MRPIRYALWSMLVIAPLGLTLILLAGAVFDGPRLEPADMGPMTSVLAVGAFLVTALIAPGLVDPERKSLPTWSGVAIAAAFGQFFALFFVYQDTASLWSTVYVPGIVVCLNLTALILVHVWVACEGFGFGPSIGLGLGGACAGWIIKAGSAAEFGSFHAVSAIAIVSAFAAGIVCALKEPRDPAPVRN
ncbi:MAG TPA: hypothetical protein VL283_03410 [Candidatus Baltobacteraceae bacterium]|nr:hypothetical protein [Candidatus Baltobacteraceae bacterium]